MLLLALVPSDPLLFLLLRCLPHRTYPIHHHNLFFLFFVRRRARRPQKQALLSSHHL